MKVKVYQHMTNKKLKVRKEDAENYAMEHLGVTIKPLDKDGVYTQEQIDFMAEFTEWYFSGDWIEEEVKEED